MRARTMATGTMVGLVVLLASACTGPLPIEGERVAATHVTNGGLIYGTRTEGVNTEIFAWDGTTARVVDSFSLGSRSGAFLTAANDQGVAVGYRTAYAPGTGTFQWPRRWDAAGSTQLPLPEGAVAGRASDLNEAGAAVGTTAGGTPSRATLWPAGGGAPVVLPVPEGFYVTEATGIDEAGDIVGSASVFQGPTSAIRWEGPDHTPRILASPDLPGITAVRALDHNDHGMVVGSVTTADGDRALVWDSPTGVPTLLPGDGPTSVGGLNDGGTIVGRVGTGATERAVRWDGPEHTLAFLAGSDQEPSSAYDISARGEIVGYVTVDGRARAARLADPASDAGDGP